MTALEVGQILSSFGPFLLGIGAIGAFLASLRNAIVINDANRRITDIHILINSRLDELLKVTAESQRAKGHAEGLQEGIDLTRIPVLNAAGVIVVKKEDEK